MTVAHYNGQCNAVGSHTFTFFFWQTLDKHTVGDENHCNILIIIIISIAIKPKAKDCGFKN